MTRCFQQWVGRYRRTICVGGGFLLLLAGVLAVLPLSRCEEGEDLETKSIERDWPGRSGNAPAGLLAISNRGAATQAQRLDFNGALNALVDAAPGGSGTRDDLQALFQRWARKDGREAWENTKVLDGLDRELCRQQVVIELVQRDPALLAVLLNEDRAGAEPIESAAWELTAHDWRVAERVFLGAFNSESGNAAAFVGFARGLNVTLNTRPGTSELQDMQKVIQIHLQEEAVCDPGKIARKALVRCLGRIVAMTDQDWKSYSDWASDPETASCFASGITAELIGAHASDPAGGARVLLQSELPLSGKMLDTYVTNWASANPRTACEFFADDPQFEDAVRAGALFSKWLEKDMSSAARWLASDPDRQQAEGFKSLLVARLVRDGDLTSAGNWIATIRDPEKRNEWYRKTNIGSQHEKPISR